TAARSRITMVSLSSGLPEVDIADGPERSDRGEETHPRTHSLGAQGLEDTNRARNQAAEDGQSHYRFPANEVLRRSHLAAGPASWCFCAHKMLPLSTEQHSFRLQNAPISLCHNHSPQER